MHSVAQGEPTFYGSTESARSMAVESTVVRVWNEDLLEAIRGDFARPTVHARNLFHFSLACFEAYAAYDDVDTCLFLGQEFQGYSAPFDAGLLTIPSDSASLRAAQETAISHAVYRLLTHRFEDSPSASSSLSLFQSTMVDLGCDPSNVSTDYSLGPAELGNHIAAELIAYGLQDGSNEIDDYSNQLYEPVNPELELAGSGNDGLVDPNAYQPLAIPVFVDQSGNVLSETPSFQGAEWGRVSPFALSDSVMTTKNRDDIDWPLYLDCGVPPLYGADTTVGGIADPYAWGFALVALWSGHLHPDDGVMLDISPAQLGNGFTTGPASFEEMDTFYDWIEGGTTPKATPSIPRRVRPTRRTRCCAVTIPVSWLNFGPMVRTVRRRRGTGSCC